MLIISGLFALQHVPKPGHKRTDSTHSSNESEYTFSSEIAETEDIPLRTEEPSEKKVPLDMSLFLKLQKRVTELEQEKQVMQDELDRKEEQVLRSRAKEEERPPIRGAELEYESLKRQELESENKKLKNELNELRKALSEKSAPEVTAPGAPAYRVLMEQLTSVSEELDVRKEEVLILRSQLVSQKEAIQPKVRMSKWPERVFGDWRLFLPILSLPFKMKQALKNISNLIEDIIILKQKTSMLF